MIFSRRHWCYPQLLERQDGVAPVSLFLDSHANMGDYARPGTVSCIVFNLGYLPSGDHSIATHKESTIAALEQGLEAFENGRMYQSLYFTVEGIVDLRNGMGCLSI